MKRKTGFSLTKHQTNGAVVKAFRQELQRIYIEISHAYGSSSKMSRLAARAEKALDRFRNEADNRVCAENPKQPNEVVCHCYYGPISDEKPTENAMNVRTDRYIENVNP
jgi:hypothetical protein